MRDWFPKQTLGSLPERAAERWGAREALYFKGRRWSFADLSAGSTGWPAGSSASACAR